MADWYDKTLSKIGKGLIDLDNLVNPKIVPVTSGYIFSQAHEFYADITPAERVSTEVAMTNVVFGPRETSAPPSGSTVPLSIDLWTGTEATQAIVNDIDLLTGKGALWVRYRTPAPSAFENGVNVVETLSGTEEYLNISVSSAGPIGNANMLDSFNSDGYSLGSATLMNKIGIDYVGWTFKAAAGFFDVVSWTGDSVAGRTISHSLAAEVGMIVIPVSGGSVYHRGMLFPQSGHMFTSTTANRASGVGYWNNTLPSTTEFTIGNDLDVNQSGNEYTAHIFAHDPSPEGLIFCGSYDGTGADLDITDMGWTPQFLLIKQDGGTGVDDWYIFDTGRGILSPGNDAYVPIVNTSTLENNSSDIVDLISTGFTVKNSLLVNESGNSYIYVAIRAEEAIPVPDVITAVLNESIVNPNGSANSPVGDQFGWSTATDGTNVIVGARTEDAFGDNSGAAYIYDMTGALLFTLEPPVPVNDGSFGYAVALSGNNVVVGGLVGLAYIFSASTGAQLFSMTPASSAAGDSFGESIAVDATYVAVGAPGVDDASSNSGEVSVFTVADGVLFRTIVNPVTEPDARFGESVAISGNNLIISAPGYNGGVGRAYIYSIVTGAQLFILSNPASTDFSKFGNRIAADGNLVVVCSSEYSVVETFAGRAHVFNITTGVQLLTINNPTPTAGDFFGSSVAIEGNTVAIGADGDSSERTNAGAVFLFEADTGDAIAIADNPLSSSGGFGSAVAVNGTDLIVGANEASISFSNAGSFYIYELLVVAASGGKDGWLDADDPVITAPTVDDVIEAFVMFEDTGAEATSPILFYTDSGLGLPHTVETTGAITVQLGPDGIAKL